MSKAAVAVTDFAKSDLQEPPKELVDAVNRYLSVLNRGRKRKPIDTIVPHRKILVGQIVIHCIWALDEQQLVKAEKTLLEPSSTRRRPPHSARVTSPCSTSSGNTTSPFPKHNNEANQKHHLLLWLPKDQDAI